MQDASQYASDDQTVAHVMDWVLDKLQLKSTMQTVFSIVTCNPDDVSITVWHASACATAGILASTTQYAARVLSSMTASINTAVAGNGKLPQCLYRASCPIHEHVITL